MRQGQQNRQRSRGRNNNRGGNNRNQLNRSMESNGPDVRIRGTASHIAEKYMQLARDAQTSGDTVAAESYWQHAEHYNRVIAAAQAAIAEEQAKRDEERARRDEERAQRQEERQQARGGQDGDDGDEEDSRPRGRNRSRRPRHQDTDESGEDRGTRSMESDDASVASGEGPQPSVDGVPAEVALNEEPVVASVVEDGGDEEAAEKPKPRRGRPRKKAEADPAQELPAFVTNAAE